MLNGVNERQMRDTVYSELMNLLVIRHGETDMNKEERLQGSREPGLPLNEDGRRDVYTLRDALMLRPSRIYSSPLLRAQETAAILNESFHMAVTLAPELVERDFGTLSGKLRSEIDPKLIEDDLEGHYDYRPYGGESAQDVRARILCFLRSLPLHRDEVFMAVTHRGVIRILYDLFPTDAIPEMILPASQHSFVITALPDK